MRDAVIVILRSQEVAFFIRKKKNGCKTFLRRIPGLRDKTDDISFMINLIRKRAL